MAEQTSEKAIVKATFQQRDALRIFMENRGSISMGEAMRRAGYSPATAENPKQNLLDSAGWEELVEHYLPDDALLFTHLELLNAKRIKKTFMKGVMTEVIEEEDTFARTKALELGYKIKGRLIERKQLVGNLTITSLVNELSD